MVTVKPRILITIEYPDQVNEDVLIQLQKVADVDLVASSQFADKKELMKIIPSYNGAIITSNIPFDRQVIDRANNLKVVSRFGVGFDRIDVPAATERGIYVTNTPVLTNTVADLVFGLIFAVARNITLADAYIKSGNWKVREERTKFTGFDISGKTLGIVGMGRVGSLVARRAFGFEMSVSYYDIIRYKELEAAPHVTFCSLNEVLAHSDIISIHTPLTDSTRGLIGEKKLALMKKTAILINTSRGPVVDEPALINALQKRRIAGAGLDVHMKEPIDPCNPILTLPNVVLTPHIGAGTVECNERVVHTAIENTVRVLTGLQPLYSVNTLT
jgi:glyoxylate reductase